MAELLASTEVTTATPHEVPLDVYMETYAPRFYEWVRGRLIPLSPTSIRHWQLQTYLQDMLRAYFALRPIGKVFGAPVVMALESANTRREPDVMVVLNAGERTITDSALVGPADLCIEIVSPESMARDHGEKYAEYEQAGVQEYWIIDPIHRETRFLRLQPDGRYASVTPPAGQAYVSSLLPGFQVDASLLWLDPLPNLYEAGESVRRMLAYEA
jgi:Uma2 family endonuclease